MGQKKAIVYERICAEENATDQKNSAYELLLNDVLRCN